MSSAFDPLNLIILAAAVVVLWRLRSVLGTRTGHERRYDPFPPAETGDKRSLPAGDDKIIPMPGRKSAEVLRPAEEAVEAEPVWKGIAAEGSDVAKGLGAIAAADPEFNPREFIEGAKIAYEMIVTAFAEGDHKTLKSLLTPTVYEGFEEAIIQREKAGETLESKLVGIDRVEILSASLEGRSASVVTRFHSQTIRATRDAKGEVVDGDPTHVEAMTDVWTFERDIRSSDPNWSLADTEEPA